MILTLIQNPIDTIKSKTTLIKKNRDSLNPRTITNEAKTRKDPKLNKTQFRKLIIGNKIQIELGNQKQRESNEPILDSLVIDLGANKKRIKKGTN